MIVCSLHLDHFPYGTVGEQGQDEFVRKVYQRFYNIICFYNTLVEFIDEETIRKPLFSFQGEWNKLTEVNIVNQSFQDLSNWKD